MTPSDPAKANSPAFNQEHLRNWGPKGGDAVRKWWPVFFKEEMGELPDYVHMPNCCGEFMVTRERVLARPLGFYQSALTVMEAGTLEDSWDMGLSFELMWHAIFGEPYVSHAVAKCDMYKCTDEELKDSSLVPPPVSHPYKPPQLDAYGQMMAARPRPDSVSPEKLEELKQQWAREQEAFEKRREEGNSGAPSGEGGGKDISSSDKGIHSHIDNSGPADLTGSGNNSTKDSSSSSSQANNIVHDKDNSNSNSNGAKSKRFPGSDGENSSSKDGNKSGTSESFDDGTDMTELGSSSSGIAIRGNTDSVVGEQQAARNAADVKSRITASGVGEGATASKGIRAKDSTG